MWILIGVVAGGIMVSSLFRWNILQGYHDELEIHIDELAALTAVDAKGQPYILRRLSDPRYLPLDSGFYWQIAREGYSTVASPSLGENRFDPKFANSTTMNIAWTQGPHGSTLEYAKQIPHAGGPPLRLLLATDKRLVDENMAEFNRSLFFALAGFTVLMIAIGALQIRFGLKPLNRLSKAVADVRSGETDRMQGSFPSEITPLVADLNGLIDSSAASVQRSRMVAGNLAHGLRTPLAILVDEADRLRQAGHNESADTIMEESRRMQRQIDFHLARARQAAAHPAPGQATALGSSAEKLVEAFTRLYQQRPIAFLLEPGDDVRVACDSHDLTEILSNLLDNAGKWANWQCTIRWHKLDPSVVIEIEDDGPGLPEGAQEAAFTVGTRLDDLKPGSGLGLAISRDLARIYGGDVELEKAPSGGLKAIVRLPAV
ncbi:MAG: HAMP domain-containing sensor histidine kinase [Novosphingobium sp.]|uniref:HAMP domain-containing sensor histidine kinase n=1 Tax=Novosphingobium sp. TaxID=1874826 RepID=UPI0032BC3E0A